MQATITFLLSEKAQREQMATTGQPVARKQAVTVEVPNEDLALFNISEDGVPYLDLTKGLPTSLDAAGITEHISAHPYRCITDATDIVAAMKRGREKISSDALKAKEIERAKLAANIEKQNEAVARFLADPTKLITGNYPNAEKLDEPNYYIGGTRINKENYTDQPACPRWSEFIAEAQRRRDVARAEWLVKQAETARLKTEKEAKEAAKQEFIIAWIAEYGSESQKARSAESLLCRDEAIKAMADFTFARLDTPGVAIAFASYLRPDPKCSCEDCHDDCEIKYSVADECDCLSESEYSSLQTLKIEMPDAKFVLRTRSAIHDCDHSPNCGSGHIHTCMVKQTVGPFTLQREYML
jgi:hypothetical protein